MQHADEVPQEQVERDWFVSSYTAANNTCVEARVRKDGTVDIRNSNNPGAGTATFTADEWKAFVLGAKDGEFDLA